MPDKKTIAKKGGFTLVPITLSQPVKQTDGFTNLIEAAPEKEELKKTKIANAHLKLSLEPAEASQVIPNFVAEKEKEEAAAVKETVPGEQAGSAPAKRSRQDLSESLGAILEKPKPSAQRLSKDELLRLLDADSLDEIYELADVLRSSSLKLYATLVQLADERGRARAKNHELMSKSGIKGIATLYKQERWLMDLKLLEKKAKPGPHDGSLYTVYKLESLPLPAEINEKFRRYLLSLK